MKVLVIVHALKGGGAERVACNVASMLSENHNVTIATLNAASDSDYPVDPRVKIVRICDSSETTPYGPKIRALRNLKREQRFDVSIGFLEQGNHLNVNSCTGERTINSIRNHTSLKWQTHGRTNYATRRKKADVLADDVVCVSREVADDQVANHRIKRRRITVINNWCDAHAIEAQAALPTGDAGFDDFRRRHAYLAIATGRFDPQKCHAHLLRAFKQFASARPDAGLVLLGDGKLREEVDALIGELGLESRVYRAGRQTNPFAYMARCDAFVLPSLYEGFSNSVLEAFACGTPVIASDCIGVRDQLVYEEPGAVASAIVTEHGIITPLPTAEMPADDALDEAELGIADALELLYADSDLRARLAANGRERVKAYAPEVIFPQWEALVAKGRPFFKAPWKIWHRL